MTINQENILFHLVSTLSPTVSTHTAFEKPIYEVPKHKYASQMNEWVMKHESYNYSKTRKKKKQRTGTHNKNT
jgi:hypothetical protein